MKKLSLFSSLLCSALAIGCSDDKPASTNTPTNPTNDPTNETGGQSQTSDTGGPIDPTTGGVVGTTGPSDDATSGGDPSAGSSSSGSFIETPDGGPTGMIECDQWTQDCAEGQKCMPYSGDGDTSWESLKCVPVDPNPAAPGSPCKVEGNGVSGIDNCEEGSMCWNVDPESGEGVCVSMCIGSPDAPKCADSETTCTITNMGVLTLCLPKCDPLIQNCPGDDLCVWNPTDGGQTFICTLDASGEGGKAFDPCAYINACDKGLLCMGVAGATECDQSGQGCCLPFCDLKVMPAECPGQGQECVPWYEEGTEAPGFENVGICNIPA